MTFSPLISGTFPHHNKFSPRNGRRVERVIQHHWAGIGGGIERMTDPGQQASCTYIITTDGRIFGHVPEEYRPWTSGSYEADVNAITYEVQNAGGQVVGNDSDPRSWPVSDAAYDAIVRLTADIARRYGWPAITTANYQGHRQHFSTACPGGFLWSRMDQTRHLINQNLAGSITYQSTSIQEDELSEAFEKDARGEFDALRGFQEDVRGAIAEINRETDGLEAFIVDVRGDLANKGAQLSAQASAIQSLTELLGKAQGLDVEQVRAAVAAAIADGIKLTVEVK